MAEKELARQRKFKWRMTWGMNDKKTLVSTILPNIEPNKVLIDGVVVEDWTDAIKKMKDYKKGMGLSV